MQKLLFYDIEIFKEDALIVLKDQNKRLIRAYWNDFSGLIVFGKIKTYQRGS